MAATETYITAPERHSAALSLPRNFAWNVVGNIGFAACQWGVLVAIARLGSTVEVGQYGLALAVTAPIFMLTNLQLRAIQATDAAQEHGWRDYLGLRLLTTALALPLVAGTILTFGYRIETAWIIVAVALTKALDSLSDVCYGMFQLRERMNFIAKSMLARGILGLAAVALVERLTGSLIWSIAAMVLAWSVVLTKHDLAHSRRCVGQSRLESLRPRFDSRQTAGLLRDALPMGIVMMLVSLTANIPRYFIEHHHGERDLGLYTAMAYLGIAGVTLVGALGTSTSPRLARHYHAADFHAFRRLIRRLLALATAAGAFGVLVAMAAGSEILTLFYGAPYAERTDVLIWLMAAAALGYVASVFGVAATSARLFKAQAPLFAGVAAVVLVGCIVLVPRYGLAGAAWSSCIAMLAQVAGSFALYRLALRRRFSRTTEVTA